MTVTPDALGMIIALFAFTVTVLGGVGGMLTHMMKRIDARFELVDARFELVDARFDRVDARFDRVDARIDRVESRIDRIESRLSEIEHDVVEVKVAIARFEGPQRRLQQL